MARPISTAGFISNSLRNRVKNLHHEAHEGTRRFVFVIKNSVNLCKSVSKNTVLVRVKLIHQSFFEAFDREKADDEDKDNNVKDIEQEIPMILACTDGAGKPNRMRQEDNLGEWTNIGGQI